jgi:uncharacterized protein (TIGR03437 family)
MFKHLRMLSLVLLYGLLGQDSFAQKNEIANDVGALHVVAGQAFHRLAMPGTLSVGSVRTTPALDYPLHVDLDSSSDTRQLRVIVPPATPPGTYNLEVSLRMDGQSAITQSLSVTVDAVTVPRSAAGRPPVILLNGFQLVCGSQDSSLGTSSETFGGLANYLQAFGPVLFFNNCIYQDVSIETLGSYLSSYLASLKYTDSSPVTQVDLVAHSMGGLIVRAYLAGMQSNGTPSPPVNTLVRKFVEIATPNFGSFQAVRVGVQAPEMYPGSALLWNLATWNQRGDDLRGVDSLAIIGNAGSCCTLLFPPWSRASDGVVSVTSASLGFAALAAARDPSRTRIVPYCHTDAIFLPNCSGSPIANVDKAPLTGEIILSFLANTPDWQSIGSSNQTLYGGLYFALENATGTQYTDLSAVSLATQPLQNFQAGATDQVYYDDFLSGTGTLQWTNTARQTSTCGSYSVSGGYYSAIRCKYSPVIYSVGPLALNVPGRVVQSGGSIVVSGVGFGAQCSTCSLRAGQLTLTVSSWTDSAITANLPATFSGLVQLVVQAAAGSDGIYMMTAPAVTQTPPPSISLSPTTLQFSYVVGGAAPPSQIVTVSNAGGGTFSWSASTSLPWMTLSTSPGLLTVSTNGAGLSPGTYQGTVSVTAAGVLNSPQTLNVTLTITSPATPSAVVVSSVTNSATFASGAIAPGEIVTITGSGLGPAAGVVFSVNPSTGMVDSTLAGTRVFFSGVPAPITYASATQVNAIVPYEVAGKSPVIMQVQYQGATSVGTTLQVAGAAPGAFTVNSSGSGQALAANQDGTFNSASNPAAKGSYVTIYFTGGGQTSPGGVTGSVTGSVLKPLVQNIAVTVGGKPATVAFAGAAPGFVDGVGQLNIQLGSNTPSGVANPLVITVAGVSSPTMATLVIQ